MVLSERGGEGYCVKEGGGEEGEREREGGAATFTALVTLCKKSSILFHEIKFELKYQ